MERSRISSKKHYDSHKEDVLGRIRKYQKDKLEIAKVEKLYELQQEQLLDLHTGDITQDEFDKLQEKMNNKLAHLHLVRGVHRAVQLGERSASPSVVLKHRFKHFPPARRDGLEDRSLLCAYVTV